MYKSLDIPISYLGIITMIISFGTIVSSVFSNKFTTKFSTRTVVIASVFLTVVALVGFSLSKNFYMLILFSIPYGLGAGAIDAALNNYVALHYKAKHLSWLHCFWGVGTIISPFVMGKALQNSTWNQGYQIVGLIQLGIFVFLLITIPVWKYNSFNGRNDNDDKKTNIGIRSALKIKGVIFILIGFFAYCSLEASTSQWASTYFVQVKGLSEDNAASLASLFFIGITFSRFLSGFVTDKLKDQKMIIIGSSIILLGIIILLLPIDSYISALVAFITIGFGCGPIYPSIIHSTPINFGEENSGAIIGIEMSSAYIGSTFMPPLFGVLGKAINFKILPIYLLCFLVLIVLMTNTTFYKVKKNKTLDNFSK
jgi:fucose permease